MYLSVANDIAYVSDTHGDLYAVNARTGGLIARVQHLGSFVPTYPAINGDWLYVGNAAFTAAAR